MERQYSSGTNLSGFGVGLSLVAIGPYYIPKASLVQTMEVWGLNERTVWTRLNEVVDKFEIGNVMNDTKIFLVDRKSTFLLEHLLGITIDNSSWRNILMRLIKSNLIYNNGFVDIYSRPLLCPIS